MKPGSLLSILSLTVLYLTLTLVFSASVFNFRFDPSLVDRYYHSQDITHEVSDRIFLSDSDIYLATGYLYAGGSDPSQNNFEHPPLIKYLFGYATRLFGNPLLVQLFFGWGVIVLVYLWGVKMGSSWIGLLASVALMFDPLFRSVQTEALLDLGQTFFMLAYLYSMLNYHKSWLIQGVLLALFAGCKFWITPGFFVFILGVDRLLKKQFDKNFLYHLMVSLAVYALFYTRSFMLQGLQFNIFWHMLRTLKYRLVHNTSDYFGASIVTFVSGYWHHWWGDLSWSRISPWSLIWPLSTLSTLYQSLKKPTLISLTPLLYLVFLGVEAPYSRYFLIILPFLYLSLVTTLVNLPNHHFRIIKNLL